MIPNNIHFIFFGFTEFAMIHYLAIKSAIKVHKPDNVFLHYHVQPNNNSLWDDIAKQVTLRYVEPPSHYNGIELKSYQYKADITRLEILIREGGIYLDIDVLSNKPFGNLLQHSCVLGSEASDDPYTTDINKFKSITNAVLMTEPNHPFMIDWLRKTADYLENRSWAYHAVCLPLEMIKEKDYGIHIEPTVSFMPFDFRNDYVFGNDENKLKYLKESYTMHFWETIWYDILLKQIDDNYLNNIDNNFTKLFKQYR